MFCTASCSSSSSKWMYSKEIITIVLERYCDICLKVPPSANLLLFAVTVACHVIPVSGRLVDVDILEPS